MVDDTLGDLGIGRKLLQKATAFVDDQAFAKAHLYTFRGLDGTYPVSKGIALILQPSYHPLGFLGEGATCITLPLRVLRIQCRFAVSLGSREEIIAITM